MCRYNRQPFGSVNLPVMYYISHSLIAFHPPAERGNKDRSPRPFEGLQRLGGTLLSHSSNQNCARVNVRPYPVSQQFEMAFAFGKDQWCSPFLDRLQNVTGDEGMLESVASRSTPA